MPSPTVSAPAPPALRITVFVAPPGPTTCRLRPGIGARCGAALIEHRVELQRAAGNEGAGASNPGRARAGDHEYVASDGVALQIDDARVGERVSRRSNGPATGRPAPLRCWCSRAGDLPRGVERGGACHRGSLSVPLLVKLLLGPLPRSAMATRSVSRPPPVVSAKCLRSNRPLLRMLLLPPTSCTKPVWCRC